MQTQITTSSTQLETRAPPISLQMTATDNSTHRVSQLKSFAVLVVGWFSMVSSHDSGPSTTFECFDYTPDNNDTSCSQHAQNSSTCGMYVCDHSISLLSFSLSLIFSNSKRNRYDTPDFNSSKLCCACGGGEQHLLVDIFTSSNSEGYTCSDISVFRSYGYEDLCSDSYDTIEFTASESCVACGGGQVVQDTWYETEEVQEVTEMV